MSRFKEAFAIIIGHEGGLSLDPRDRGNWTSGFCGRGELKGTKYGIAAHAYPHLDIRNLTLEDAERIYRANYWDALGADALPAPLALVAFDTAVNSGVGRARQFLARTQDWRAFLDLRLRFLQSLSTWPTFGRGWQKRVDTLRTQAAAWEAPPTPPRVLLIDGGGKEVAWDGRPTRYGGMDLNAAVVEGLRTVYPAAGGPWGYGPLRVWRRQSGDLVLERAPTPK